jgi:hypothetical protein
MRPRFYSTLIFLTLPFIAVGVAVGLFELCCGTDGRASAFIAGPFLWAYDRQPKFVGTLPRKR